LVDDWAGTSWEHAEGTEGQKEGTDADAEPERLPRAKGDRDHGQHVHDGEEAGVLQVAVQDVVEQGNGGSHQQGHDHKPPSRFEGAAPPGEQKANERHPGIEQVVKEKEGGGRLVRGREDDDRFPQHENAEENMREHAYETDHPSPREPLVGDPAKGRPKAGDPVVRTGVEEKRFEGEGQGGHADEPEAETAVIGTVLRTPERMDCSTRHR